MISAISHDRQDESLEAKVRWFQSLSIDERMQVFCELTRQLKSSGVQVVQKPTSH